MLIVIILSTLFIIYFTNNGRPIRLTSSISYDSKLMFLKNNDILKKADTIVIGSSMGLNNIDSSTLEKSNQIIFTGNLSSWGLAPDEVEKLLELVDLQNIKTIIYSTQYLDFNLYSSKKINYKEISYFLNNQFSIYPYLKTLKGIKKNFSIYLFWGKKHLNKNKYNFLGFDKNGDININLDKKHISKPRWSHISKPFVTKEQSIQSLINISNLAKKNNIKLIVITTPFRKSLLEQNSSFSNFFTKHTKQLKSLSMQHDFTYINTHQKLHLSDSYFIDSSHLNYNGAKLVSQEIINILK